MEGMLSTLLPLHEMMRKQGPTTLKEIAFVQAGRVGVCRGGRSWGVRGGNGGWQQHVHAALMLRRAAALPDQVGHLVHRLLTQQFLLPPLRPFLQAYGRELDEAYEWCLKYKQSRKEAELHQVGGSGGRGSRLSWSAMRLEQSELSTRHLVHVPERVT